MKKYTARTKTGPKIRGKNWAIDKAVRLLTHFVRYRIDKLNGRLGCSKKEVVRTVKKFLFEDFINHSL